MCSVASLPWVVHPGSKTTHSPGVDVEDELEDDDDIKAPRERYANIEPADLPVIGPDGGFAPGAVGVPPSVPAATPENFVCLRGPCRHYWQRSTFMASGNPDSTWGEDGLKDVDTGEPLREPRQIDRTCLAHPGTETELTEDTVYECSRWVPVSPLRRLTDGLRKLVHLKLHPSHRSDR